MASAEAEDLPRTNVRRIVRAKLSECSGKKDVQVNKDALLAFSESAKIFIHYLSAAANEICHESKRQTISAADILTAVKELDFPEFVAPLEATLEAYRAENKTKKSESKARSEGKKRKAEVVEEADTKKEPEGHSGAETQVEEAAGVADGTASSEPGPQADTNKQEEVRSAEETEGDRSKREEEEITTASEEVTEVGRPSQSGGEREMTANGEGRLDSGGPDLDAS